MFDDKFLTKSRGNVNNEGVCGPFAFFFALYLSSLHINF